jgi:hypothetical protein
MKNTSTINKVMAAPPDEKPFMRPSKLRVDTWENTKNVLLQHLRDENSLKYNNNDDYDVIMNVVHSFPQQCRISNLSHQIVSVMDQRADSIDALLLEWDTSMSWSRHVFNQEAAHDEAHAPQSTKSSSSIQFTSDGPWDVALTKARARQEQECPICLNPIEYVNPRRIVDDDDTDFLRR